MEGHLPCLKYILSNSTNMNNLISARNDQGDTPKTMAQQFFKDHVSEYLEAIEWDRDHPEQAESKLAENPTPRIVLR
jgi:ankyrin repeat domain-containing protein 42